MVLVDSLTLAVTEILSTVLEVGNRILKSGAPFEDIEEEEGAQLMALYSHKATSDSIHQHRGSWVVKAINKIFHCH